MIPTNNTSILRGNWSITRPGMVSLLDSMQMAVEGNIDFEDFFNIRGEATIDADGIGHVFVKGALVDNAPGIFEKIGCTDYRSIIKETQEMAGGGARAIMYHVDSPGGTVAGCAECADEISAAGVPTLAYTDGMMCSAAYYLGASCEDIAASRSADVGNIGTILAWWDDSELLERMGIRMEVITNEGADLKGTFRESPMTESQRAFLQRECDGYGAEFRQHVKSHRDVSGEVFRAGWYHGEDAGHLGLVDAIGGREWARNILSSSLG